MSRHISDYYTEFQDMSDVRALLMHETLSKMLSSFYVKIMLKGLKFLSQKEVCVEVKALQVELCLWLSTVSNTVAYVTC